jgi:hypothetical protein
MHVMWQRVVLSTTSHKEGYELTCISTYFVYASVGVRAEAGSGAPSELALPGNAKHCQAFTVVFPVNTMYSWSRPGCRAQVPASQSPGVAGAAAAPSAAWPGSCPCAASCIMRSRMPRSSASSVSAAVLAAMA